MPCKRNRRKAASPQDPASVSATEETGPVPGPAVAENEDSEAAAYKMEQLANQKDYDVVREWIRSVSNHLYYSAASSEGESGDMVVPKWKSVVCHVQNVHEGFDDPLFDRCIHPPYDPNNHTPRPVRSWLIFCSTRSC